MSVCGEFFSLQTLLKLPTKQLSVVTPLLCHVHEISHDLDEISVSCYPDRKISN